MNWDKSGIGAVDHCPQRNSTCHPSLPAFAPLISSAFDELKNLPAKIDIPAGTAITNQGVAGEPVSLILSGLVKLVSLSPEGRQATLGLRTAGWHAGAVWVLMNVPSSYSVITITPCSIAQIPAHEFSLRLMQSAKMTRHFTAQLCNELISQSAAQVEVMMSSAEDRLAHFMSERTANHPKWKVLDTLPLLKQVELAQLLAITPEHLSRLLHKSSIPSTAKGNVPMARRVVTFPHGSRRKVPARTLAG